MKKLIFVFLILVTYNSYSQFEVSSDGKYYKAPIEFMYEHARLLVERDSCKSRESLYITSLSQKNSTINGLYIELEKVTGKNRNKNIIIGTVMIVFGTLLIVKQ